MEGVGRRFERPPQASHMAWVVARLNQAEKGACSKWCSACTNLSQVVGSGVAFAQAGRKTGKAYRTSCPAVHECYMEGRGRQRWVVSVVARAR